MDPMTTAALISGGASLLGGFASNSSAKSNNKRMIAFQREMADKQMAFQERMSNTAHQREVEDLRAAGLNPILSGTGGMGSSSPTGSVGSTPQFENEASAGISSALDALSKISSAMLTNAQTDKTKAEKQNVEQSTNTGKSIEANYQADTRAKELGMTRTHQEIENLMVIQDNLKKTGRLTSAQTQQVEEATTKLVQEIKTLRMKGDIDKTTYGQAMYIAELATKNLSNLPLGKLLDLISRPSTTTER